MSEPRELLLAAYRDFNAHDSDAIRPILHPSVVWQNGIDGSVLHGAEALISYWKQLWETVDPQLEPRTITQNESGRWVVEVHHVIRNRNGRRLEDKILRHVYSIENGLITRRWVLFG